MLPALFLCRFRGVDPEISAVYDVGKNAFGAEGSAVQDLPHEKRGTVSNCTPFIG